MDEKQLAKLIRKATEQPRKPSNRDKARRYDPTLPPAPDDDTTLERDQFFKEMKRRPF
jgi:hypothetical protein